MYFKYSLKITKQSKQTEEKKKTLTPSSNFSIYGDHYLIDSALNNLSVKLLGEPLTETFHPSQAL